MAFHVNDRVAFPADTFCKCTTGTILGSSGNDNYIVLLDFPDEYGERAHVMYGGVLTSIKNPKYGIDSVINGFNDMKCFNKDGWYRIVIDVKMEGQALKQLDEMKIVYMNDLTAIKANFPSTKDILNGITE